MSKLFSKTFKNQTEELELIKNKKKRVSLVIGVIALLLVIGGSYAFWNYNFLGDENLINKESVELEFLESSSEVISIENAFPMIDSVGKVQDEVFSFQVKTNTKSDIDITYGLFIEKLEADTGYTLLNDNEIKVYLTDYNNNELVLSKINELNNYMLYSDTNSHDSNNTLQIDKFKLRVWVDEGVTAKDWDENTKLQYKFKIGVRTVEPPTPANKPVLSDNMIPVYYDETCNDNAGCWEKADSTNSNEEFQWYDYDNKMWANSVTVSNTNREEYLDADPGTEIPMDDILTMQVWIPRYKYTVWNYNSDGTATSDPQEIDITFEEGTATTGEISCTDNIQGTSDGTASGTEPTTSETCTIKATSATCTDSTCNGKTYTHPAFTFGDKELEGIWVGKFEVSSDTNCTPAESSAIGAGCNLTSIRPLVKPDVTSWTGAMVGTFENNMMAMNDSENKYGFATTDDTHMMKNMEWGAVAYLSHSKYGINKEININNSSGYYTGRSGGNVGGSTNIDDVYVGQVSFIEEDIEVLPLIAIAPGGTDEILYVEYGYYTYDGYLLEKDTNTKSETRDLSKVASTTGNIYGIYDMSGGAEDYVMGNIVSPNGETMMSGNRANTSYPNDHSGYSGILFYNDTTLAGFGTYEYPDNKYYDKYSFNTASTARGKSKLGDGIKEVYNTSDYGWYSDRSSLAYSYEPWFRRGGSYYNGSNAGVFNSYNDYGFANINNSARLVISQ